MVFKISCLRLGAEIIANYAQSAKAYHDLHKFAIENNTLASDDLVLNKKFDIPNAPGLGQYGLLPHQASVLSSIEAKKPRYTILDVQAGGGKTVIIISQILLMLKERLIRRPLIVVPGPLVKEFYSDIRKFCKDRVNIFPIRLSTIKRLRRTLNPEDREGIVRLMRNMPENTLFIADYEFLKSKYDPKEDRYERLS